MTPRQQESQEDIRVMEYCYLSLPYVLKLQFLGNTLAFIICMLVSCVANRRRHFKTHLMLTFVLQVSLGTRPFSYINSFLG